MRKKDNLIVLSKEEKKTAIEGLQTYLSDTFELESGNLAAEFLLDYITKHIGPHYYNQGVIDSYSFVTQNAEDLYSLIKES